MYPHQINFIGLCISSIRFYFLLLLLSIGTLFHYHYNGDSPLQHSWCLVPLFNLTQEPRSDETKRDMCFLAHTFHSSDDTTILVHRLSVDKRLFLRTLVPRIDCVNSRVIVFTFAGDAARRIIVSPHRNS